MHRTEFFSKTLPLKSLGSSLSASVVFLLYWLETATVFAQETAEASEARLDPLAWKGDLALWTAVVFLLLLLVLSKFAFGPIVKALDQREKNELAKVEATERANADAKALLEEYRRKLDDSNEEARRIVADAKKEVEIQADAIIESARTAAEQERARAIKDVQAASDAALRDLAEKTADLATSLAGKILKERIDPQKHSELVQSAVEKMTNQ